MDQIIIAVLGSSLLSTLISTIVTQINRRQDKKSGYNKAMRLVLKDRLRYLCEHYISQGWIYSDELDDIIVMHACYHTDLEGNGYLDTLMSRVKALEVRGIRG